MKQYNDAMVEKCLRFAKDLRENYAEEGQGVVCEEVNPKNLFTTEIEFEGTKFLTLTFRHKISFYPQN